MTLTVLLWWDGGWFDFEEKWMICDRTIGGLFPQLLQVQKDDAIELTLLSQPARGAMAVRIKAYKDGFLWRDPTSGIQWNEFTQCANELLRARRWKQGVSEMFVLMKRVRL